MIRTLFLVLLCLSLCPQASAQPVINEPVISIATWLKAQAELARVYQTGVDSGNKVEIVVKGQTFATLPGQFDIGIDSLNAIREWSFQSDTPVKRGPERAQLLSLLDKELGAKCSRYPSEDLEEQIYIWELVNSTAFLTLRDSATEEYPAVSFAIGRN